MLLFFPAVSPALFLWPLIGGSFKGKEKLQLPVFFFFFFRLYSFRPWSSGRVWRVEARCRWGTRVKSGPVTFFLSWSTEEGLVEDQCAYTSTLISNCPPWRQQPRQPTEQAPCWMPPGRMECVPVFSAELTLLLHHHGSNGFFLSDIKKYSQIQRCTRWLTSTTSTLRGVQLHYNGNR